MQAVANIAVDGDLLSGGELEPPIAGGIVDRLKLVAARRHVGSGATVKGLNTGEELLGKPHILRDRGTALRGGGCDALLGETLGHGDLSEGLEIGRGVCDAIGAAAVQRPGAGDDGVQVSAAGALVVGFVAVNFKVQTIVQQGNADAVVLAFALRVRQQLEERVVGDAGRGKTVRLIVEKIEPARGLEDGALRQRFSFVGNPRQLGLERLILKPSGDGIDRGRQGLAHALAIVAPAERRHEAILEEVILHGGVERADLRTGIGKRSGVKKILPDVDGFADPLVGERVEPAELMLAVDRPRGGCVVDVLTLIVTDIKLVVNPHAGGAPIGFHTPRVIALIQIAPTKAGEIDAAGLSVEPEFLLADPTQSARELRGRPLIGEIGALDIALLGLKGRDRR